MLALKSVGEDADKPNDPHGTLDALGISADELRRYEDFKGRDLGSLDVWSGESRFGMTCLLVAVSDQGTPDGFSAEGCSLKGKDTILDVQMGDGRLTSDSCSGAITSTSTCTRGPPTRTRRMANRTRRGRSGPERDQPVG